MVKDAYVEPRTVETRFSPEDLWILHLISREERIPAALTGPRVEL